MSTATVTKDANAAVETLLRGYEEEINLYMVVRKLTLNQREMLLLGRQLDRVFDAHEEKEDLLAIIGQIDDEMAPAKDAVMSHPVDADPRRMELARLLDRLTGIIEETRRIESSNAALLQAVPQAV